MSEDVKLHGSLQRYLRGPLAKLSPWMRIKVMMLLVVWELANLAGFSWQALVEAAGKPALHKRQHDERR